MFLYPKAYLKNVKQIDTKFLKKNEIKAQILSKKIVIFFIKL